MNAVFVSGSWVLCLQLAVRMFQDIAFNEAGDFVMEWEGKECSIGELPHEWHNDKGLQ